MKTKTFIFFVFSIVFYLSYSFDYGGDCSSKSILQNNYIKYESYSDVKLAFSDSASCRSLKSAHNFLCCFIKNKFKNELVGEKFTHRGCIEISYEEYQDIKGTISTLENLVNNENNITKADIDIDCSSKYIQVFGLLIFILFLL